MLTRVAIGQVRFTLPGLAPDARGIALGREFLLRFGSLDRAIAFLRILSGERLPDEFWSQLRLEYARVPRGPRELTVRAPASSTAVADTVAAAARLAGGQGYTGAGRHFVPYRDAEAQLGYDIGALSHESADLFVYTAIETLPFSLEGELPIEQLLLRLDLRRATPERTLAASAAGPCFIAARRGLGPVLIEYLHRAGVDGGAALCEPERASAFGGGAAFWLLRTGGLPRRIFDLVTETPGFELFLRVVDNAAVAAGFEHPVHLDGCAAALPRERFLLFRPSPDGVMLLPHAPRFVPLSDLVRLSAPPIDEPAAALVHPRVPSPLVVPVTVAPGSARGGAVRATWIAWRQVGWFKRLCYALPSPALRGYRAAVLEGGLLVVAGERLEGIPFGTLLEETTTGVLVPVGMRLRPAISPDLLRERLGLVEGSWLVFPAPEGRPFRVPPSAMDTLERRLLGTIDSMGVEVARSRGPWPSSGLDERAPEIENDPLGLMPLWGLSR